MSFRKVRIRDGFSDRNGINVISKDIILNVFPEDVRKYVAINFNNLIDLFIERIDIDEQYFAKNIIENVFNDFYDKYSYRKVNALNDITSVILESNDYSDILDIIEKVSNILNESYVCYRKYYNPDFSDEEFFECNIFEEVNKIFVHEFIGYRFVGNVIVSISNNDEIQCIQTACLSECDIANNMILKAINFISESGSKDYKNCIKESIGAVESFFNSLLNTSGLTLSNALNQLSNKISIHPSLKEAIRNLYKYASDEDGIRHGNNKENYELSFDEAKFILLICSSLINYFSKVNFNG